jgi:ABC-type transport system involved in cytochrome c biogenesis ATPase subunit
VAIVRALAMRPKLLLLDEITSSLDPELVAEVLNIVRELAEEGMTMSRGRPSRSSPSPATPAPRPSSSALSRPAARQLPP